MENQPIKTFEQVRAYLGKFQNINRGGCGIAALVMYDFLVKEGYKPKIVYLYSIYSGSRKTNIDFKKGKINKAAACSHVVISFKGQYIDALKTISDYEKRDYEMNKKHTVTREHLVNSLKYGCWNSEFKRGLNLPKIEKKIGYKLLAN